MVFRSRYVGQGMREDLTIRNFADEPALCAIEMFVGADFADLFAVKEGRAGATGPPVTPAEVRHGWRAGGAAMVPPGVRRASPTGARPSPTPTAVAG